MIQPLGRRYTGPPTSQCVPADGEVPVVTIQKGEMTMVGTAVVDITNKTFDRTFDAMFGEWPDLACVVQSTLMCKLGRSADS